MAWALQLTPAATFVAPVRADAPPAPKAVFIVGPTGTLTDSNLSDAERMAVQAETAGMDVRRVFFPDATWDNVLANIQGASLVVYMGHGYGWPSPYTKTMTESRQNGMGLNSYAGSGKNTYTYYGANRLRESVQLAPNAVVFLNHLCYASGNAEPGMAIPGEDLARQRVDNMANGWLAVGARAVFAYGWWQRVNYPLALMTTDKTMDELFMTPADGSPKGWTGWRPARFDSVRTPGATNHLDPHSRYGYYRAVTGDLNMTAAAFRAGATGAPPVVDETPAVAPEITELSVQQSGTSGAALTGGPGAAFHPNGDGLDEELVVTHSVTKSATLDVTVADSAGTLVRMYSVNAPAGSSTSRWDGRSDAGTYVPDDVYTLTFVPRDASGLTGAPAATQAAVLTAIQVGTPSAVAFFGRDGDILNATVALPVTLNQPAQVTWQLIDAAGAVVRTVRADEALEAGPIGFTWDGRADDGSWAPDGWYRSVVTAQTNLGVYSHTRSVYAGAFRITPSTSSPARGRKLTLTVLSTENLSIKPKVTITQPGLAPYTVTTTKVGTRKYKVTVTLKSAGDPGALQILARATDKKGAIQETAISLELR